MRPSSALAIGSVFALGIIADRSSFAEPTPKPKTKASRKPAPKPAPKAEYDVMRMHMHANFDLVRAIERLLIRGNVEDAKRFANAIAVSPDEPAHGPWAARMVEVRNQAADLARVTSAAEGVRIVAKLGAACGDCHAEAATGLSFATPPPEPPDKPTIEARMLRHRWAADRLWEGIVGNSDEAWNQGLTVLAASPPDVPTGRVALARELGQVAERARRAKSSASTRAATYGQILQLCTSCHASAPPKSAR